MTASGQCVPQGLWVTPAAGGPLRKYLRRAFDQNRDRVSVDEIAGGWGYCRGFKNQDATKR